MIKKFLILVAVLALVFLFITKGIPMLDNVKDRSKDVKSTVQKDTVSRVLEMDISIESMCVNMVTMEEYPECNKDNCDATCKNEGCSFFGLKYINSTYIERCICKCYEENKIKKALSGS